MNAASSPSPLASKLPEKLRRRLDQRKLRARRDAAEKLSDAATRRQMLLKRNQRRNNMHNEHVRHAKWRVDAQNELHSMESAQKSSKKQRWAQVRKQRLVASKARKAAAHNASSRLNALGKARLDEVAAENERRKIEYEQTMAEQRAAQHKMARANRAAQLNWRAERARSTRKQRSESSDNSSMRGWDSASDGSLSSRSVHNITGSDDEGINLVDDPSFEDSSSSSHGEADDSTSNADVALRATLGRQLLLFAHSANFRQPSR